MPDAHGVVPVDEAARPLGARQLEPPQRTGLAHDAAALVHHDATEGHSQTCQSADPIKAAAACTGLDSLLSLRLAPA